MSEIQRWTPELVRYFNKVGPGLAKHEIGSYVLWTDHVAAMQAARPQPKFTVGDRVLWGKDLGTVTEPERESDRVAVSWDDGDYSTVRLSDLTLYAPPALTCGCPGGYAKVAEVPTSARPERNFKIGNQVTHRDSEKVRKIKNYYFSSENNEWKYDIGFYYVESELTLYVPPIPAELIPTLKEHEWVRGTYKTTGIAFGPCSVYYNEIGAMSAGDNNLIHWDTGKISDELATLERCEAPVVVK